MGLFLLIAYFLAVWFAVRQATRAVRDGSDAALRVTLVFLVFNLLYVAVAGNFLELGENMRFRSMVDPFILVIVGLFVNQMMDRRRRKGRAVEGVRL
jgi:hypothetical protein